MNFIPGLQLYINNKWFFDILEVLETNMLCRIKYKEGINSKYYLFKTIKLNINIIEIVESNDIYCICKIDENIFKNQYGSLIDRLVIEENPYIIKINEDVSGMGSVSQPGLSGVAGVPGTSGSGDISNGIQLSYEKPFVNNNKDIKKAIMDVLGMKEDISNVDTDADYKNNLFNFIDYPWTKDIEFLIIEEISKYKEDFISISIVRIQQYINDLYKINKASIDSRCSNEFINKMILLANIS